MSDDSSESRIAELEKEVEMMKDQTVKKDQMLVKRDQPIEKLTEFHNAAFK